MNCALVTGILVDVERLDVHRMLVKPPRRVLPRILHIHADVVDAFNLDSGHSNRKSASGILIMPAGVSIAAFVAGMSTNLLVQHFPFVRVTRQRPAPSRSSSSTSELRSLRPAQTSSQDRAVPMRLDRKRQHDRPCRSRCRLQFDAVVKVEVAQAVLVPESRSVARRRRIRCDSRWSTRSALQRPAAGENAVAQHRRHRLPAVLTRNGAIARSIVATRRVASASRGVIPFQMPQIFSQLSQPTPLKKANCRSLVFVAVPAIGDIYHVPRFEPLVLVHQGRKGKLSIAPRSSRSTPALRRRARLRVRTPADGPPCPRRARTPAARRPACRR